MPGSWIQRGHIAETPDTESPLCLGGGTAFRPSGVGSAMGVSPVPSLAAFGLLDMTVHALGMELQGVISAGFVAALLTNVP